MPDPFAHRARTPADPAVTSFDVVPDDATDLPQTTTALNVIAPGRVRVTMAEGTIATLSISPGQAFPVRVRRVWQTGTTATGITGLA